MHGERGDLMPRSSRCHDPPAAPRKSTRTLWLLRRPLNNTTLAALPLAHVYRNEPDKRLARLVCHSALRIGKDLMYELQKKTHLFTSGKAFNRKWSYHSSTGPDMWSPFLFSDRKLGVTSLNDDEIQACVDKAYRRFETNGGYHAIHNNCHLFVHEICCCIEEIDPVCWDSHRDLTDDSSYWPDFCKFLDDLWEGKPLYDPESSHRSSRSSSRSRNDGETRLIQYGEAYHKDDRSRMDGRGSGHRDDSRSDSGRHETTMPRIEYRERASSYRDETYSDNGRYEQTTPRIEYRECVNYSDVDRRESRLEDRDHRRHSYR
ncbi:hypothetical protein F5Y15DRAFT_226750 [Xylariaceae sp. FL0016]|nr:hypothetical protein F5Y15DRAFT_226750 [Xylariaceae sp. FL0016]